MRIIRWIFVLFLLHSFHLVYALAPKSQSNKNLLYEFNVEDLLKDGYVLYSEPGQDKVLAFFLGRFHDYYQVDIFDLVTKERVGYIDFSIHNFELEKWASLSTALILWQDRIYSQSTQKAADEYGLGLKNLKDVNSFRENTPVNPPPAYHLRDSFTKRGSGGWRHLSEILVGIAIFAAIKEGVDRMTLDPEDSLQRSLFYERRFGALPQKGWYLSLYPIVYERLNRVNLGGMSFNFQSGRFSHLVKEESLPGPLDVFVESIPSISEEDLQKIDKETKEGRFPDRHVWSFLKAVSELLEGDGKMRLKSWVSHSLESRGKKAIKLSLSLSHLPKEWRRVVLVLLQKGIIEMNLQLEDLEFSKVFEFKIPLPSNDQQWFARSA